MKKSKNLKKIFMYGFIAGAVAGIAILLLAVCFLHKEEEAVEATFRDDDLLLVECGRDSLCFAFDTGANATVLYSDTVPEGFIQITDGASKDIFSRERTLKRCFALKSGKTGLVQWLQTLVLLPEETRGGKGEMKTDGIWGTDIICSSCWWIDFSIHRISNRHTPEKTPDYVLEYYLHQGLLYTDIFIGQHCIDSVMIDLGFTRSDFALPKRTLEKLQPVYSHRTICYNMVSDSDSLNIYTATHDKVNERLFNHLTFAELPGRKLIGLPFFKRFTAIFLDTEKQQVECYL